MGKFPEEYNAAKQTQVSGASVGGAGRKERGGLEPLGARVTAGGEPGGAGAARDGGDRSRRGRRRENAENMYYFSELALTLNEHEEGVAPTDSRLRPDQRLMEKGHWDEANTEKQRLEEKQRASRRRRLEACARGCGSEDGEAGRGRGGGPAGEEAGCWGRLLRRGSEFRGPGRRLPPTRPPCPPSREGDGRVHAAVVREESGPAHRGDGLHLQGRLLGGQGAAGLAHVPQHLLSTTPPTHPPPPPKYRRPHGPGHLFFNTLNLVLTAPPPPHRFLFLLFL